MILEVTQMVVWSNWTTVSGRSSLGSEIYNLPPLARSHPPQSGLFALGIKTGGHIRSIIDVKVARKDIKDLRPWMCVDCTRDRGSHFEIERLIDTQ